MGVYLVGAVVVWHAGLHEPWRDALQHQPLPCRHLRTKDLVAGLRPATEALHPASFGLQVSETRFMSGRC